MIEIHHKKTGEIIFQFDGDTLSKADLRGVDLRSANLRDQTFFNTNLSGANLSDADLTGARLPYVEFTGADLTAARLSHTDLQFANFTDANLTNAYLANAGLLGCHLQGAVMDGVVLSFARVSYTDLSGKNLSGIRARFAAFNHVKMIRTLLTGAVLIGTKFHECDLTDARMDCGKLSAAVFIGATLQGVDFFKSEFRGTCFMGCADLHQAIGLADVRHRMPWRGGIGSSLDVATLRSCVHCLPESFLQSLGYEDDEIRVLRELYPETNGSAATRNKT
jgi:uncharacterized protein YjbI with pentapeptide repeats